MKKLLLILLCVPLIGLGQGWETTYGGADRNEARSVQQTNDGGYIVGGNTYSVSSGEGDFKLWKIDVNGAPQWTQTYNNDKKPT